MLQHFCIIFLHTEKGSSSFSSLLQDIFKGTFSQCGANTVSFEKYSNLWKQSENQKSILKKKIIKYHHNMNRKKGPAFQIFITQAETYGEPQTSHDSLYCFISSMCMFLVPFTMFPHFHFIHDLVFFYLLYHICSFLTRTFHTKVIQSV